MTVKISQENGKAVVSVDGNEALKADAAGNVEVVGDLAVEGLVADAVNGLEVGLGGGANGLNSAVGEGSLTANTTGIHQVAVGRRSLASTSSGRENTSVGSASLENNITGSNNTAIGRLSLTSNLEGSQNTTVGFLSGSSVTGSNNTVLGSFTGNQNGLDITASDNNIAISDGSGKVSFFKDSSDNVHLRTGNQNRLTVQPSGNVSIANDLEVNGTTIAALIARIEALEAGN